MATKIPSKVLDELKSFVQLCKVNPSVLHLPELKFYKDYLESLGALIPGSPMESDEAPPKKQPEPETKPAEEPELEESDVELDMSGVVEPDTGAAQDMGDRDKNVTEEDEDKSNEKKMEAVDAFNQGDFELAAELYTEAIKLNPHSALLFAKRANCYLHLNKPNAAIRDCDRALEMNPDSATAHKFRGRAERLLGNWEEAAKDLRLACNIDYDDQANEWLKEVTPNVRKLQEHRRKYERLREEKLLQEREERLRKAREEQQQRTKQTGAGPSPFGSGGPGFGFGGPGGPGGPDLGALFEDPEIMAAFQDPDVAEAFKDISMNPMNAMKYQSNPKVAAVINKLATKFGGLGGGMGFPGGPGAAPPTSGAADDLD